MTQYLWRVPLLLATFVGECVLASLCVNAPDWFIRNFAGTMDYEALRFCSGIVFIASFVCLIATIVAVMLSVGWIFCGPNPSKPRRRLAAEG
jgi:hypothetical protein